MNELLRIELIIPHRVDFGINENLTETIREDFINVCTMGTGATKVKLLGIYEFSTYKRIDKIIRGK